MTWGTRPVDNREELVDDHSVSIDGGARSVVYVKVLDPLIRGIDLERRLSALRAEADVLPEADWCASPTSSVSP